MCRQHPPKPRTGNPIFTVKMRMPTQRAELLPSGQIRVVDKTGRIFEYDAETFLDVYEPIGFAGGVAFNTIKDFLSGHRKKHGKQRPKRKIKKPAARSDG